MIDTSVKKGLAGVVVDYTAISKVNSETNSLLYRGSSHMTHDGGVARHSWNRARIWGTPRNSCGGRRFVVLPLVLGLDPRPREVRFPGLRHVAWTPTVASRSGARVPSDRCGRGHRRSPIPAPWQPSAAADSRAYGAGCPQFVRAARRCPEYGEAPAPTA